MSDENDQEFTTIEAPASVPESEGTAPAEDVIETQEGEEQPTEPKTFTQEEVDRIAQKEREKAYRKAQREIEARAQEANRPANFAPPTREQFPVGDAGDQAFWNASVDYTADQKLMQREQQKQQTQVKTAYQEREESVREKYPDFQEVAYKDPDKGGPAISELMADVLRKSEHGPELFYYLGKNVNESHRIWDMDPIDQVREMTKLEAKVASTSTPARKVSSAPEPIRPIAGSGHAPVKYSPEDPRSDKTMTHAEWIAQRNRTAPR